jgi:IS4 transposase
MGIQKEHHLHLTQLTKETLIVRVIEYQIPGFRPCRLITSILEEEISARELVIHYHRRWDIEISFDEIKPFPVRLFEPNRVQIHLPHPTPPLLG